MFEASTPFLNLFKWLDRCNKTGSFLQKVIGVLFASTFFFAHLVWGFYQSKVVYDVFADHWEKQKLYPSDHPQLLPFAFFAFIEGANVVLNGLNVWWFFSDLLQYST